MFKGFKQIAILTVISRILGMLRDMAFAFFFGAGGLMDSWVIAFMVPNLARRLFGEGASSSSLIPVYSHQLEKNPQTANNLASTVVSVVFVILACIVLFGEVLLFVLHNFFCSSDELALKLNLTAIMLPYMLLICITAIIGGILNSHRHFAAPAAAPVVLNIFIIGSLFFTGYCLSVSGSRQLYFTAVGVLIAGFGQLFLQFLPLRGFGISLRPRWQVHTDAFKSIIALMAPMIIGLTATQLNTLADVLIARGFSGSLEKGETFVLFSKTIAYPMWDGAASLLFYAQRLYQFPLGVFGISLATAVFPVMSTAAAKGDTDELCRTIAKGLKAVVFIAVPATAGLFLVRTELVSLLFERGRFDSSNTAMTAGVLVFYSLGLCGFFAQQLTARAFYSLKDSSVPTRSALVAVCVNVVLNFILIWPLGAAGLAFSTAFCSYLQVGIMLCCLKGKLGAAIFKNIWPDMLKSVINTLIMFAIAAFTVDILSPDSRFLRLLVLVLVSVAVYFAGSIVLSIDSLALVAGRWNKKTKT